MSKHSTALIELGYIEVEEGLFVPSDEERFRKAYELARQQHFPELPVKDDRSWASAKGEPCEGCGKQSSIFTAGCDHCDYEDK